MKKAIVYISLLSISVAYCSGLVFFAINEFLVNGKVDDFGVIIFWSGIFELVAWAIFFLPALLFLKSKAQLFAKWWFPFLSTIYAVIVFTILIGWVFLDSDFYIVFYIAALVGFVFGLTYSVLINQEQIIGFLNSTRFTALVVLLYPSAFLWISFWLFPKVAPSTAFRFMPNEIQNQIIEQAIKEYKTGDDFEPLNKSLPGYFDHFENGNGNLSSSMSTFAFVLQVNCGKIIVLKFSNDEDFDMMIDGNLNNIPCADLLK